MNVTHTKGPWRYAFDGHGGVCIETDDCDGVQIGFVSRGHEANAQLVAAAPELLEIAKEHAASCPSCNGTGQRMHSFDRQMVDCEKCRDTRAVIAKATGAA